MDLRQYQLKPTAVQKPNVTFDLKGAVKPKTAVEAK